MSPVDKSRFVRVPLGEVQPSGGKIRNWREDDVRNDVSEFLSRIWSLYGSPDEITFEGFEYLFRHTTTGLLFSVYSGASGPAYGGEDEEQLLPICDVFDELLETATLVDCQIEFNTDFGMYRVGVRNGVPFGERIG